MEGRASKLRKLDAFRRALPHISASALSAVLAEVERSGIPEVHARADFYRATAQALAESTPYGPLLHDLTLQGKSGGVIRIPALNPPALLHVAYSKGGGFSVMLQQRLAQHPSTPENPWRIILYTDEVVPGNALSHDNRRKVWVVYFSFLELGASLLSREDSWFCLLVVRSSVASQASAGMAQIFRAVL